MSITIEKGTPNEIQALYDLIVELAIYEKAEHEVKNTPQQLHEDAFGTNPVFEFFVAKDELNEVQGICLFYTGYSTWKGKTLYLDDLVVKQSARRQGIGAKLLNRLIAEGKSRNAAFVSWQVLDWNQPAIEFYKQYDVQFDESWVNVKLFKEAF